MNIVQGQHGFELRIARRFNSFSAIRAIEPIDTGAELPERAIVDLTWREAYCSTGPVEEGEADGFVVSAFTVFFLFFFATISSSGTPASPANNTV